MMKKVLATIALAIGLTGIANAKPMQSHVISPALEKSLTNICKAVKSNKKLRMYQAIKAARLDYKTVQEGLVCNGHNVLDFALLHGAEKNAIKLAKKAGVDIDAMLAKR